MKNVDFSAFSVETGALFVYTVIGSYFTPQEDRDMRIRKIVLTGGPSAGKTTGLSWIRNAFSKLGYTVLFVPETATELISGGVAPWTTG